MYKCNAEEELEQKQKVGSGRMEDGDVWIDGLGWVGLAWLAAGRHMAAYRLLLGPTSASCCQPHHDAFDSAMLFFRNPIYSI
jgi:hypothetical protein